jgi:hypothetical protein
MRGQNALARTGPALSQFSVDSRTPRCLIHTHPDAEHRRPLTFTQQLCVKPGGCRAKTMSVRGLTRSFESGYLPGEFGNSPLARLGPDLQCSGCPLSCP